MTKREPDRCSEYYYFTIDDWTRGYAYEVNRHKWEMSPDDYAERDELLIAGRLRSKTKRKFTTGEAHILPSYISRKDHENGADRIGNVWTKPDRIFCSAFIPSDAYFSLVGSLSSGKFVEMNWRVNNLKYRKGEMDALRLEFSLSDLDEELRDYQSEPPVIVDPQY